MIKPLEDKVLIKMRKSDSKTASGILLVTKDNKDTQTAKVIEVGEGKRINGKIEPVSVKKGDNVIVRKYAGTEIKYQGEDYVIIKEEDIIATY